MKMHDYKINILFEYAYEEPSEASMVIQASNQTAAERVASALESALLQQAHYAQNKVTVTVHKDKIW